ncbi:hypothetical protein [Ruegeria profundi]|uniref:hypothetical protein n=1 Tax=Ruegeria profundi TaxID=1685378 RepID=UPI00147E4DF1
MFRFPKISSHFKLLAVAAMMLAPPVAAQHAHSGAVTILSVGGNKLVIYTRSKHFVHRHHAAPVLKHKVKLGKRVLHPRRKLVLKHHRPRHLKHRSFGLRHRIHRKFR